MAKDNNPMFRYLMKYVGVYRVMAFYDVETEDFPRDENGHLDDDYDGLYIPCSKAKSYITHTYDPGYLMWYCPKMPTGRSLYRQLENRRHKLDIKYEETDFESMITFHESDLPEFAKYVRPKTSGASIKPYSDRNLPKPPYEIPEKDLKKLEKLFDNLTKQERMVITKKCIKGFDTVIQKKMGKKYDIAKERRLSKLKPKVFIHSIGMWDEFLEYTKKQIK